MRRAAHVPLCFPVTCPSITIGSTVKFALIPGITSGGSRAIVAAKPSQYWWMAWSRLSVAAA